MKVSKSFINKPINQQTQFLLLSPFVDTKCVQKLYKQSCIHPKNWIKSIVNNNKNWAKAGTYNIIAFCGTYTKN
jgi:hypothetical protein